MLVEDQSMVLIDLETQTRPCAATLEGKRRYEAPLFRLALLRVALE